MIKTCDTSLLCIAEEMQGDSVVLRLDRIEKRLDDMHDWLTKMENFKSNYNIILLFVLLVCMSKKRKSNYALIFH